MPLPQSIRSLVPLVIGLAVGGLGTALFQQSLPPAAGSPEERADQLAAELKRATNRIAALEAAEPSGGRRPGRATQDRLRMLADDLRAGRPVSPDDIFAAIQPVLADLTPLFDRVRLRNQAKAIEAMASELAGRYDLNPQQQAALGQWLEARANDNAKRWNDLVARKDTRLADLIRATHDVRLDDGLDQFMATTLTGDKLAAFNTARMADRAERVQQAADRQVARLDAIVKLDDAQRDQIFGLAARSSRDYDPARSGPPRPATARQRCCPCCVRTSAPPMRPNASAAAKRLPRRQRPSASLCPTTGTRSMISKTDLSA
jgi:hypothetical protein